MKNKIKTITVIILQLLVIVAMAYLISWWMLLILALVGLEWIDNNLNF
jgi:hypothetical protein